MGNRYLVLSDLHLCDVEEHADGWKAYKREKYLFDRDVSALVERFLETTPDDAEPVLVLNGDVFDFDLVTAVPVDPPWPVRHAERVNGLDPTAAKSVFKLQHMLSFHGELVRTLARFVGGGHRLVYVLGNHDREFHFPEVKTAFVSALRDAALEEGLAFDEEAVRFEPWFHYVPGEIYVEHGNQYDHYTSFRYALWPVVKMHGESMLALPMGNLSNRHLINRMGFFNPHASDYILNVYRYVAHWFRHYVFSKRALAIPWLLGSFRVMTELLDLKRRLLVEPPEQSEEFEAVTQRSGLPRETVKALARLWRPPITQRFFGIVRELWIDRVVMLLLMIVIGVVLELVPIPLWIKLMVPLTVFPLVFFVYEEIVKGEDIFTIEHRLPECARAIGELLPVRVVTFGHTHKPRVIPLDGGLSFVDTGTWAPIMRKLEDDRLVPGYRNYLVADFTTDEPKVELLCWGRGPTGSERRSSFPPRALETNPPSAPPEHGRAPRSDDGDAEAFEPRKVG